MQVTKSTKSMILKSVLASALLVCVPLAQAVPPYFKWAKNDCWLEVSMQLLYNILELVDYVLKNEASIVKQLDSDRKMQKLVPAFTRLVRQIQTTKQPDDGWSLDEAHTAYGWDNRPGRPFFDEFMGCAGVYEQWKKLQVVLMWDDEKMKYDLAAGQAGLMIPDLKDSLVQQLRIVEIKKLAPYFFIELAGRVPGDAMADIPLRLEMGGYAFELITVVINGGAYGTSHYWTYVKDQREKGHPWYRCFGLNNKPKKVDDKKMDRELNDLWNDKDTEPLFLLYKLVKLPLETPLERALKNFSDSLDALRGQLVPKP